VKQAVKQAAEQAETAHAGKMQREPQMLSAHRYPAALQAVRAHAHSHASLLDLQPSAANAASSKIAGCGKLRLPEIQQTPWLCDHWRFCWTYAGAPWLERASSPPKPSLSPGARADELALLPPQPQHVAPEMSSSLQKPLRVGAAACVHTPPEEVVKTTMTPPCG